ncbi:predicted protein [Arabidopsis lyrata subsp. lyrata]|uniref:Predicted protein n=1 Tax=Arabidopsis lyrata subsp. lyrata TaxID=81972 RepID=D7MR64_ARALL|nr:predicted protein [Arabidopsis lyrata subsp. lyrata]
MAGGKGGVSANQRDKRRSEDESTTTRRRSDTSMRTYEDLLRTIVDEGKTKGTREDGEERDSE